MGVLCGSSPYVTALCGAHVTDYMLHVPSNVASEHLLRAKSGFSAVNCLLSTV